MTREYSIAVLAGDGIGKEVIPAGIKVLNTVESLVGDYSLNFEEYPWGTEYYLKNKRMMPVDGLNILEKYNAIFLGAVGMAEFVPDHITLWEFLLPIRKSFDQYVNLRPTRLLPGVKGPLRDKGPEDIDFLVVRENTEGEYAGAGGSVHSHTSHEVAIQTSIFTRMGVERVMRYSFELARKRPRKNLISVTKSNACQYSMVFWDEIFSELCLEYPDIESEKAHVDALAARFVNHPESLDVIVASNLFGDILTDLGGAIQGSLGMAPSANINPEKRFPSMFEPVHGSAPDIAGKGLANPIATVWAGAMMLEFLGEEKASRMVMDAILKTVVEKKKLTRDLGGSASTDEVTEEICTNLIGIAEKEGKSGL